MKIKCLAKVLTLCLAAVALSACTAEPPVDIQAVTSQPRAFVSSETCKKCHLEHYDSWKMTMHSRMLQDAKANQDAIIVPIEEKRIREDLAKLSKKLKVPADKIYVPKIDEILYTIGSQWKQRFLIEKDGTLFISPIQYNADTHRWVNYHEHDYLKRPWLKKCGGCTLPEPILKRILSPNPESLAKHVTEKGPGTQRYLRRRFSKSARPLSIRPNLL